MPFEWGDNKPRAIRIALSFLCGANKIQAPKKISSSLTSLTCESDLAISRLAGHGKEELDVTAGRVVPTAINSWWGWVKRNVLRRCVLLCEGAADVGSNSLP